MFFSRVGCKAPLVAAAACQVLLAGVQSSSACGLDWRLPSNHFDGVDAHGHISYWERIGEVDCGDGLDLPLQINFNSSRDAGASSPYLGQGWLLPLLESKFVQDSEDHFHMVQPDGYNNRFIRDKSDETVLNGSAGWKGQINGETITAWAACGWKIVFTKGRITSMTSPKGRRLDWAYEGGRVSELREGSVTRLKVEYGPDGRAAALALPDGKRIVITEGKKPQIQTIAGQNVIAGVESSLGTLALADGQKRNFVFATDEKMLPTLKVEGQSGGNGDGAASDSARLLSWNPQTNVALRDGDWTYQITQSSGLEGSDAAIGRTNTQGKKEYWFDDKRNGQETTLGTDGVQKTKYWFVSGTLMHKLRRIEEIANGKKQVIYQAAYDDQGRIIREITPKTFNVYTYDGPKGNTLAQYSSSDNKLLVTVAYNTLHQISSTTDSTGRVLAYLHDDKGRETQMMINGKIHSTTTYAPDGSWKKEDVYDHGDWKISRTFYAQFDKYKRLILRRTIQHGDHPSETTVEYTYDELGKAVKRLIPPNATQSH